jgi:competence protein ComEC
MNRWLAPAFLAVAWLLGIAAAAFTEGDPAASVAAAGLLGVVSFARWPRPATLALVASGAVLIFAAGAKYESTVPEPSPIAQLNCDDPDASDCKPVRLRAMVDAEPDDQGASRSYRLDVREVFADGRWRAKSGGVLMRATLYPAYDYGDLIEIKGRLEAPPLLEEFDYREYLNRRGVRSVVDYPEVRLLAEGQGSPVRSALIDIRSRLSDSLANVLPEPEASLAAGILFGTRSEIPQELKDDMNATGTSHLVAVSGQNVVLLAGLTIAALAWIIGRRNAAWIALAGLIAYACLVGLQPSVFRAAIMGTLYVVAIAVGRQNTAYIALSVAAAIMTAREPQLVHEVSFQLSFAATIGLIVMTPILGAPIEGWISRWTSVREFPLTRLLQDVSVMTTAATLATIPIIAINFQRVSLIAPLANLFAVPAFVAVATTSALTAIVGILVPGEAGFMSWLAVPPAAYMIGVIRLFADVPLASAEVRGVGVEHAIVYYAALSASIWWLGRQAVAVPEPVPTQARPATRRLVPATALVLVLGLSSALLWLAISATAQGRLSVTILDVGQGDAILIEGPQGHRILVDGGPSGEAITAALGRHLPFHDNRIDLVVLTHPQADHFGGLLEVLERYDVRGVLTSPVGAETAGYLAWTRAVTNSGVSTAAAARGQWIDLGGSVRITVLGPPPNVVVSDARDLNSASVVLKASMGDVSFLLTGDADEEAEASLIRSGMDLRATVLKVAHHGSRTSTSERLLRRVQPAVDVISVGAENRYGHPVAEVLERLEGDLVLRTDEHGDVTVSTDGRRLWVQTQRAID